jgi:hypothetical protein
MKYQTTTVLLALLMVFAAPMALAEEVEVDGEAQIQAEAGISPDSPLYGLETAIERFRLSFTRNPERRAQRALNLADERMAEFEEMASNGNMQAAEKARVRYEQYLETAAESSERIKSDESEEQAEEAIRSSANLRAKMQLRLDHLDQVYERIVEKRGENITEEQLGRLDEAYNKASEKAQAADLRVESKREQAKNRLRVIGDLTEEEAEARAENLSSQLQERIELRAERLVTRFENKLAQLENDSSNRSQVATQRLRLAFEQKINRTEFKAEVRSEALQARMDGASRANRQEMREEFRQEADELRREFQKERDEVRLSKSPGSLDEETTRSERRFPDRIQQSEIEVVVYNDYASVQAELRDEEFEFDVRSTDRAEITRLVAAELGISVFDVRAIIEFERSDDSTTSSNPQLNSCQAYWEGYVFVVDSASCEFESTSACSNPFEYSTESECVADNTDETQNSDDKTTSSDDSTTSADIQRSETSYSVDVQDNIVSVAVSGEEILGFSGTFETNNKYESYQLTSALGSDLIEFVMPEENEVSFAFVQKGVSNAVFLDSEVIFTMTFEEEFVREPALVDTEFFLV